VYEAFCSDGSCLPPVIFTSSKEVKSSQYANCNQTNLEYPAYVIYIPNIGAPSTRSTTAWIELVSQTGSNFLGDKPYVILDSLQGHFAEQADVLWAKLGIKLFRLPGGSGKWLNPCDQAINCEMRRTFNRLQQANRKHKIENIVTAYYSIKESTIINSFHRCGLFEGDPEDIVSAQASQGFHATPPHKEAVEKYNTSFLQWKQSFVHNSSDLLPHSRQTLSLPSCLDGACWAIYGLSP
jgi:hypothetical protein